MKYELDLVKPHVEPLAEDAPTEQVRLNVLSCRKNIREEADRLIHDALLCSDLLKLAEYSADVMLATAAALTRLRLEPTVEDFVYAAKELVEDARKIVDMGLQQRIDGDVRIGAVCLELVSRGICATLSVPYEKVLAAVNFVNVTPGAELDLASLMPTGEVAPAVDWRALCGRYMVHIEECMFSDAAYDEVMSVEDRTAIDALRAELRA